MITQSTYLGYDVDIETREINAPCGCHDCNESVISGHFSCSTPPADLLEDEQEIDGCYRSCYNGFWRWYAPVYACQNDYSGNNPKDTAPIPPSIRDDLAMSFLHGHVSDSVWREMIRINELKGNPNDCEHLVLTLCSNCCDLLTPEQWLAANAIYGLYRD